MKQDGRKRYFVVDNGGTYSDHCLYFVETKLSKEEISEIIESCADHSLVGEFKPIWWEGEWTTIRSILWFPYPESDRLKYLLSKDEEREETRAPMSDKQSI